MLTPIVPVNDKNSSYVDIFITNNGGETHVLMVEKSKAREIYCCVLDAMERETIASFPYKTQEEMMRVSLRGECIKEIQISDYIFQEKEPTDDKENNAEI